MKPHLVVSAAATLSLLSLAHADAQPWRETLRRVCQPDVQRLCAGWMTRPSQFKQCLRDHETELSPGCRGAIASARMMRDQRRSGGLANMQPAFNSEAQVGR